MVIQFHAESEVPYERYKEVAALDPMNPFYTPNYVDSRRKLGFQPWLLSMRQDDCLITGCTAFSKSGRLTKRLEIPSLCAMPDGNTFWKGMLQFCKKSKISNLNVNSFASNRVAIPSLPDEIERRNRIEYVLYLKNSNLWDELSSNHRRNIKRGLTADLQMRCIANDHACEEHARLGRVSMIRRNNRGESVTLDIQSERFLALIESGAGELYQATGDSEVLSSVLVLKAEKGAYYQSAGTSPEGMKIGASHFLIYNIAEALQKESMELFNLGGAYESKSGLQRFKSGFGATEVKLEAAQFFLGSKFKKQILKTARKLRNLLGGKESPK